MEMYVAPDTDVVSEDLLSHDRDGLVSRLVSVGSRLPLPVLQRTLLHSS